MHKYLSAQGIVALQEVADWLKGGAQHEVSGGAAFSMVVWNEELEYEHFDLEAGKPFSDDLNKCGTVMCIGGAVEEFNDSEEAPKVLYHPEYYQACIVMGEKPDVLYLMFHPKSPEHWAASPEKVANVVQHFIDTGAVDWSLADV